MLLDLLLICYMVSIIYICYSLKNFMESTLRKTIISLYKKIDLQFVKIIKFNRFGCKAVFCDFQTGNLYDVNVLSRSLLQLNSISQLIFENLNLYQNINNKVICPIYSATEDGDMLYIISKGEKHRLSELVDKRQGLTQFQIIYFLIDLIETINYLKSRGLFYQTIDIDEIYLTKDMKLFIPFSIWVSPLVGGRSMLLREEDRKGYIAPELWKSSENFHADQIISWNIGIFIYQIIQGVKPFTRNSNDLCFNRVTTPQVSQLISKLLKKNPEERLKFPLILLQSLFKKYPSLPHILPPTIFSCPPSNTFVSQYCANFHIQAQQKPPMSPKIRSIRTAQLLPVSISTPNNKAPESMDIQNIPIQSFKSTKYIKPSDRSLTESKNYVSEFVDISDVFGYGYLMNSGLICFVYNDGSEMYFQNGSKKTVTYTNEKKVISKYVYEKISQQSDMKKKLFILQSYSKSIKKYKQPQQNSSGSKPIIISQYYRTNSASVFMLSNQTIQVFFNDKIIFILTKHSIHVQNKNSDKFQSYQTLQENSQILARKKYAIVMAAKLFHWDCAEIQRVKGKGECRDTREGDGNAKAKITNNNIDDV